MNTREVLFDRVALIGAGLIGSSLARVIRREHLANHIVAHSRRPETRTRLQELGIADTVARDVETAVNGADLIVISVPVGASGDIAEKIGPHLKDGDFSCLEVTRLAMTR